MLQGLSGVPVQQGQVMGLQTINSGIDLLGLQGITLASLGGGRSGGDALQLLGASNGGQQLGGQDGVGQGQQVSLTLNGQGIGTLNLGAGMSNVGSQQILLAAAPQQGSNQLQMLNSALGQVMVAGLPLGAAGAINQQEQAAMLQGLATYRAQQRAGLYRGLSDELQGLLHGIMADPHGTVMR
uniref:Uncharacterized protein n=1 Tax=Chlamydomonas leiostraca TaxID=1034604 RepID=A0A7S0RF66_9CHLO|mmetsp:Transcript_21178/g.53845  ORF Transcript_21178/g.53845 Transcript_21178/m.53845 type:complete len:183 (+) Transcript_21178:1-549(+)